MGSSASYAGKYTVESGSPDHPTGERRSDSIAPAVPEASNWLACAVAVVALGTLQLLRCSYLPRACSDPTYCSTTATLPAHVDDNEFCTPTTLITSATCILFEKLAIRLA